MFITTALSPDRYDIVRAAAITANANIPSHEIHAVRVGWESLKDSGKDGTDDPFSALNGNGSEYRRRRWTMALALAWVVWDLPTGSPAIPCYICGEIFDAFSQDGEHIVSRDIAGTFVGNLLLACHSCNLDKAQKGWQIPESTVNMLINAAAGMTIVRGSLPLKRFAYIRDRRPDGSGMGSWRPGQAPLAARNHSAMMRANLGI